MTYEIPTNPYRLSIKDHPRAYYLSNRGELQFLGWDGNVNARMEPAGGAKFLTGRLLHKLRLPKNAPLEPNRFREDVFWAPDDDAALDYAATRYKTPR